MNDLSLGWHDVLRFLAEPLFTLGDTPLSPARLSVVALIFLIAMRIARLGERTLRRIVRGGATQLSEGSAYALGRIARYVLLVGGLLLSLSLAGVNFSSLTVLGGALGLGIGIGLQPLFANFVSGVVLLLDRTLKVGDFVDLSSARGVPRPSCCGRSRLSWESAGWYSRFHSVTCIFNRAPCELRS